LSTIFLCCFVFIPNFLLGNLNKDQINIIEKTQHLISQEKLYDAFNHISPVYYFIIKNDLEYTEYGIKTLQLRYYSQSYSSDMKQESIRKLELLKINLKQNNFEDESILCDVYIAKILSSIPDKKDEAFYAWDRLYSYYKNNSGLYSKETLFCVLYKYESINIDVTTSLNFMGDYKKNIEEQVKYNIVLSNDIIKAEKELRYYSLYCKENNLLQIDERFNKLYNELSEKIFNSILKQKQKLLNKLKSDLYKKACNDAIIKKTKWEKENLVYIKISKNAYAYHRRSCYISGQPCTLTHAIKIGRFPCRICEPPAHFPNHIIMFDFNGNKLNIFNI